MICRYTVVIVLFCCIMSAKVTDHTYLTQQYFEVIHFCKLASSQHNLDFCHLTDPPKSFLQSLKL